MSSELRWILLIIGVVFFVGLALWERRRPRQANSAPNVLCRAKRPGMPARARCAMRRWSCRKCAPVNR